MKRIITLLAVMFSLALPATALAATNPLSAACSAPGASSSAACSGGADPIVGTNGVLKKTTLIIATIAGLIAVIIIIIAGLQFVLSNGDAQKIANARSAIIGAAVGLFIIMASEGILLLVVSRI